MSGASAAPLGETLPHHALRQADAVPAYGGKLVSRHVMADEAADLLLRAAWLPRVPLEGRAAADAELIASGALSPLEGFLCKDDYLSVVRDGRLASGIAFPVAFTLTAPYARRADFHEGREAALVGTDGPVGVIAVDDVFEIDGYLVLGGRITLARAARAADGLSPRETRARIARRGWRRIGALAGRGDASEDERLLGDALDRVDGVLVRPVLASRFPVDRTIALPSPLVTRDVGARQRQLDAIVLQNHGVSHVIQRANSKES
jgi:sulfate adenylyltransferase